MHGFGAKILVAEKTLIGRCPAVEGAISSFGGVAIDLLDGPFEIFGHDAG